MAIKFVDRVPTRPGRIKITPENGSAPWYGVMERADEPSVVGTPINAANLNAIQQNQGMSANMTVYVTTSGSDSLGDGSRTAPYATITKALSVIPKQLNGNQAIINIASGTYPEAITISGFSGGTLTFTGVEGESVSVLTIVISNVDDVVFSNLNYNVIGGNSVTFAIHVTGSQVRVLSSFHVSNAVTTGVYALLRTTIYFMNLTVSEVGNAVAASNGATLVVANISGSAKEVGFRAIGGGVICFTNNTMSAPTMYVTSGGGRIYSGAQTNIPNY